MECNNINSIGNILFDSRNINIKVQFINRKQGECNYSFWYSYIFGVAQIKKSRYS